MLHRVTSPPFGAIAPIRPVSRLCPSAFHGVTTERGRNEASRKAGSKLLVDTLFYPSPERTTKKIKGNIDPFHFQYVTHWGPCGKAPAMAHSRCLEERNAAHPNPAIQRRSAVRAELHGRPLHTPRHERSRMKGRYSTALRGTGGTLLASRT